MYTGLGVCVQLYCDHPDLHAVGSGVQQQRVAHRRPDDHLPRQVHRSLDRWHCIGSLRAPQAVRIRCDSVHLRQSGDDILAVVLAVSDRTFLPGIVRIRVVLSGADNE